MLQRVSLIMTSFPNWHSALSVVRGMNLNNAEESGAPWNPFLFPGGIHNVNSMMQMM